MWRLCKYCLWLVAALVCCGDLCSQEPGAETTVPESDPSTTAYTVPPGEKAFVVRNIVIVGNRKTRPEIIRRELSFKPGDRLLLQDLVKKFEFGRRQLMNTALFHEVIVALKSFDGYDVDVLVQVKERWYLFPVPYFKPVDRNLNQWLVEQNASLTRVNYGMKLLYNNATGRNDKLRFWLISGYTRQLTFNYDRMYIDKKMKWGLNLSLSTGKNREMNYNTIDDKQVFLKNDNYIRKFFSTSAELTYRNKITTRHRFGLGYTTESVDDTIVKLNPGYFSGGRKRIAYPELYYTMTYMNLDYNPYPTKGYAAEISLNKKGINSAFNLWQVSAKGSGHWPMGKKTFFSLYGYGTLKLPFKQPYYGQRLLGYSDIFMQGYEYYVVDGVAGGYLKTAITHKLFDFDIRIPGTKKIAPQRIPINIYGRIYGNAGYIHNPYPGYNYLSNKMLYSSGIGIDITTIYDFTLKLEWSFNQLGQNGLFLHRKTMF